MLGAFAIVLPLMIGCGSDDRERKSEGPPGHDAARVGRFVVPSPSSLTICPDAFDPPLLMLKKFGDWSWVGILDHRSCEDDNAKREYRFATTGIAAGKYDVVLARPVWNGSIEIGADGSVKSPLVLPPLREVSLEIKGYDGDEIAVFGDSDNLTVQRNKFGRFDFCTFDDRVSVHTTRRVKKLRLSVGYRRYTIDG